MTGLFYSVRECFLMVWVVPGYLVGPNRRANLAWGELRRPIATEAAGRVKAVTGVTAAA
jgi:hypothetical protein